MALGGMGGGGGLNLPAIVQRVFVDTSSYAKAQRDTKGFTATMQRQGQTLMGIGSTLSKRVTLPVVGLGAAAIATGAQFERGMNRVKALSGATGNQFEQLRNQAKELGETTQFSATQAADAMGFLAMAGFDTTQILGAMPSVLELAASAQMDLARAADITSNILTGYGLEVSELGKANDVLVKSFTSANTDLEQLGQAFKFAGPVAKGAGLAFEDTAATLALMGNAGIQASMAGTSLRGALTRVLNPTGEVSKKIEELGLNLTDSSGQVVAIDEFVRQLAESGATTGDMMALFGQRAGPAMSALVGQGADAITDLREKLENSGGTASRIAKTQMEGFSGSVTRLKSALEGAAIAVADTGLLDLATGLVDKIVDLVSAFNRMDPKLRSTIMGVAGLAAALGPLSSSVGWLMGGTGKGIPALVAKFSGMRAGLSLVAESARGANGAMGGLRAGMGSLATLIGPQGLIVAGLALAAGGFLLYKSRVDALKAAHDTGTEGANALADAIANAGEAGIEASEEFDKATMNMRGQLRTMRTDAQREAFLIDVGFKMVNEEGMDPEAALEAVQQLIRDANDSGEEWDINLDTESFTDIETRLEALRETGRRVAEEAEANWLRIGSAGKETLADLGQSAARAFTDTDPTRMLGGLREMAAAQQGLTDEYEAGRLNIREYESAQNALAEAMIRGTEISGLSLNHADDLRTSLETLASEASNATAEQKELAQAYLDLMDAGMGAVEAGEQMARAQEIAAQSGEELARVTDLLVRAEQGDIQAITTLERLRSGATGTTGDLADAQGELADATDETTRSMEEQSAAILAASDPLFGAIDATDRLAEAQRELEELEASGEATTEELAAARRNVAESAFRVEGANRELIATLAEEETTVADVNARLREYVDAGLISEGVANDVSAQFRDQADAAGNLTGTLDGTAGALSGAAGAAGAIDGAASNFRAKLMEMEAAAGGTGARMHSLGYGISSGIAAGIEAGRDRVYGAIITTVRGAERVARLEAKMASPSKLFRFRVGQPITEGIAQGILDKQGEAESAITQVIDGMQREAEGRLSGVMSGLRGAMGYLDAQDGLTDAKQGVYDLEREERRLPRQIAAERDQLDADQRSIRQAQLDLQRARADARKVTLEERYAIEQAEQRLADTFARYQSGEASSTEVLLAEQALNEAIAESTARTQEVTEAERQLEEARQTKRETQERLRELNERAREVENELADAHKRVHAAQLDLVQSGLRAAEAGRELIGAGKEGRAMFIQLAKAVGLSERQMQALLGTYTQVARTMGEVELAATPGGEYAALAPSGGGGGGAGGGGGTYTVRSGDSLSAIAARVYGSAGRWRELYDKNRGEIGPDPNLIRVGQVLKLRHGGDANAGQMYEVGEEGRELFVPKVNGTVYSNEEYRRLLMQMSTGADRSTSTDMDRIEELVRRLIESGRVSITNNVTALDPRDAARQLAEEQGHQLAVRGC